MLDFQKLSADYRQTLLHQVVPFWLKNGRDELCGGYFDMLSATGDVIEGDKCVLAQAQQARAFSWLYATLNRQSAWLDHARHGGIFLRDFASTNTPNYPVNLDRRGRLLGLATDSSAACSIATAYAQLYRATGEEEWATLARQTFADARQTHEITRTQQSQIGGLRQLQHLGEAVALLEATLNIQTLLDEESGKAAIDGILHEIMYVFLDRRTDTLREYVLPDGAFVNTPRGRRLSAGLTFQTVNHLLDLSAETGNRKINLQVVTWSLRMCEQAWDEATGGLTQYIDMKGEPSIFPDAQQKWAWVQVEALACLIKGFSQTRHPDCLKWFRRVHDYTFAHFSDPAHAGWHLVLDRQGKPLLPAKSIPETSCFSIIKCLAETAITLTKCEQLPAGGRIVRSA